MPEIVFLNVVPDELKDQTDELNACLTWGRNLSMELADGKRERESLSEAEERAVGLVALVHMFADRVQHLEATIDVAAKDQADALSRLIRAKMMIDALREQYRGMVQLGKHEMGAGMMGAVDNIERALGSHEKPLAAYVKEAMSECSVKVEEIQL